MRTCLPPWSSHFAPLGHDADTVVLEGLQGAPDDQVVPAAAEADRLLITLDRGIGTLALRLRPEPGAMIVRSRRLAAPGIADDVLHIVQGVRDWQEFKGHVVVADRAPSGSTPTRRLRTSRPAAPRPSRPRGRAHNSALDARA